MSNNSPRPLRILSLDGGGVRGLTSLLLLQSIFESIESATGRSVHPHEYFDLIAGTSTGGLIAIMLGRLRMSIKESIEAYKVLSPQIFKKKWWSDVSLLKILGSEMNKTWFQGQNLQEAVCSLLADRQLDRELRLIEAEDPQCKVFVCAVNAHSSNIELLRSYKSTAAGQYNHDCSVWEAARATTAAPLFFEPVTFRNSGFTFVDGAVRANNPVEEALNEARSLWPGREIACLLSLGTGVSPRRGFHPKKNRLHSVLASLAKIAMDANAKHIAFKNSTHGFQLHRQQRYFRFSVVHGLADIDVSEFEKLPLMQAMTIQYTAEVSREIEECARKLILENKSGGAPPGHGTIHGIGVSDTSISWDDADLKEQSLRPTSKLSVGKAIVLQIARTLSAYNQVLGMLESKTDPGNTRGVRIFRERFATHRLFFQTQCFLLLSSVMNQGDVTALHESIFSTAEDPLVLLQNFRCTEEQAVSLESKLPALDILEHLRACGDIVAALHHSVLVKDSATDRERLLSAMKERNGVLHNKVLVGSKYKNTGAGPLGGDDHTEKKLSDASKANAALRELQTACKGLWSCKDHPSHFASVRLSDGRSFPANGGSNDSGVIFDLVVTDNDLKSSGHQVCLEVELRSTGTDGGEAPAVDTGESQPEPARPLGTETIGSTSQQVRKVTFEDEFESSRLQNSTRKPVRNDGGTLSCPLPAALPEPDGGFNRRRKISNPAQGFSLGVMGFEIAIYTGIPRLSSDPRPSRVCHSGAVFSVGKADKMRFAACLADLVLTHHSTPWLDETAGSFCSSNVSFWSPSTPSERSGLRMGTPFLCYAPGSGSTDTTAAELRSLDPRAKNLTLFALGILLLELEFGSPIESIIKQAQDPVYFPNKAPGLADGILTIRRLAGREMGTTYGRIVRMCLDCDFGLGLREYSLRDVMLQKRYYLQVISEFENLLPRWEKIYGSENP
ncbi:hypothetical protein OQA88_13453 [Cercophora sp. LCS_1]